MSPDGMEVGKMLLTLKNEEHKREPHHSRKIKNKNCVKIYQRY